MSHEILDADPRIPTRLVRSCDAKATSLPSGTEHAFGSLEVSVHDDGRSVAGAVGVACGGQPGGSATLAGCLRLERVSGSRCTGADAG